MRQFRTAQISGPHTSVVTRLPAQGLAAREEREDSAA